MWRWVAVVLISVGGLCLGYWGLSSAHHYKPEAQPSWASPIIGGIVLVSGLILLLIDGQREYQ